jgi:peptidoglycan hydrolase-like protein with peptidoglycan-binding domain
MLAQLRKRRVTEPVPDQTIWVGPDGGTTQDPIPTSCDVLWTLGGRQYFVPAAVIARRSPTSAVPAVFVDRVSGGWSLRLVLEFRRHPNIPADQGEPLAIGGLTLRLYCPLDGGGEDSLPITDITEQTPIGAGVVRRLVARVPVTSTWLERMRTMPGSVLLVTGTAAVGGPDPTAAVGGPDLTALAAPQESLLFRGGGTMLRWRHRPAPDQLPTIMLTVEPSGASMYFRRDDPAGDPVYAQFDGKGSGEWVLGPGGAWQTAPAAGQFYALPTEYRLAFDVEHSQPAVTVLLLEPPAPAPGQPSAAYRARIRFKLVPWFDPQLVDTLRRDISESTGVVYPELVVGGYQSADFATSTLFNDLGGTVLGQGDASTAVDGRGFELVFECSMEFYTLMCGLLAPAHGAPTGLEGRVRFTLAAQAEGGSPTVRDVPVRIRLDLPADDYLTFEQVPLPDPVTWPPGWVPPVYARVRNLAAGDADVGAAVAVLLVESRDDEPPDAAVAALAVPASFRVPGVGTPVPVAPARPVPPPPPAFPGPLVIDTHQAKPAVRTFQKRLVELKILKPADVDGYFGDFTAAMTKRFQRDVGLPVTGEVDAATWAEAFPMTPPPPPSAGPGEVVLTLAAQGGSAVDPSTIGALALGFAKVTLRTEASAVLEKVHQLAAATTAATTVRVRSVQLAHPESLPPGLTDLYQLDVQIRRDQRPPVTAYLTREEPDKTVTLSLLIGDLVAGVDPQQPTFDWRRRNVSPAGPGEFSEWETVTGRELFATPVIPGAPDVS